MSQAQRLKKFSQEGKLDENVMDAIMTEEKRGFEKLTLSGDRLLKYFPKSYTPKQIEDTIFRLLEQWQRKRQQGTEKVLGFAFPLTIPWSEEAHGKLVEGRLLEPYRDRHYRRALERAAQLIEGKSA